MKTIELDMYQATAVAALVLLLGRILVAKISILRRYCIPAPVVGGFLYAIVHTIVRGMGILEISCDMTLKNVFMVAFFCSVGFTASFRMLKKGDVWFTAVMLRGYIPGSVSRYGSSSEHPGCWSGKRIWSGSSSGSGNRFHPDGRWSRYCWFLRTVT